MAKKPQDVVDARPAPATLAPSEQFVHLHLHTEYSLLDGGNRIDKLVSRVKELGMEAVGITDHGNLFGAVAIYLACREAGIKPILGVEAYVAPGSRHDRTYTGSGDGGFHLVLLAENDEGWRNLLFLCSEAYLTGFYYKPRIDRELLAAHSAGLIAINGHLGSEIGDALLEFHRTNDEKYWERAVESAKWHAAAFGGSKASPPRFFIELQKHVPEQNAINPLLVKLARELTLPLLADNDAHFLRAEDHDAHDTLICISTATNKSEQNRMRYPADVYVKSPAQMRSLCDTEPAAVREAWKEGCDNTVAVAARCNVTLPLGVNRAPMVRVVRKGTEGQKAGTKAGDKAWDNLPRHDDARFSGDPTAWFDAYCAEFEVVPVQSDAGAAELAEAKAGCDRALRMLAAAGTAWRYSGAALANDPADTALESRAARLERELSIICDKGISAYFLIVWDFVNWGRQNGIPALARGSGVGTMVGYVLGLSNACPVQYGLLFERFTDPDRAEFPDIDIDMCQDGRARVIDYVRRKYGHVAQIITFGTLKARAAVRDVGRVLGISLPEVDRLAKLIPEQLGMTLDRALEAEPDLKAIYDSDERITRLIDNARTLEGQARHASVHAAGVIVATRPLHEVVPLYKQSNSEDIVTQWDGPTCEKMGLLKMDFLGLRTISVVERAKQLIRETLPDEAVWEAVGRGGERNRGQKSSGSAHPLDFDRLSFDDQRVFDLFRRGETTGVFQFESPGMRRLLMEMKPDRLEDLIAANALFRPGPMDLIPDYNRRKHGLEDVPRIHPIVEQYTAETYGVMVYQEQVMQIVHGLGGVKLRDAYTLIKNISKKKHDKIEKERPKFVEGAQKQGLSRPEAEKLFEMILKFAGYGFNKSHSTGYAIVAYQTAYLKTYFPNQYMAAFLSYESGASKVSDWTPYLEDCRKARFVNGRVGVEVRPPDVNLSQADFTVVFEEGEPRDSLHGHVRFGMQAIKGAGEKAIAAIVAARDGAQQNRARQQAADARPTGDASGSTGSAPRPFTSIFDFCERVLARSTNAAATGVINKATIEALVKSGSFDSLHGRASRASVVATIEQAMSAGQKAAADLASGQSGLFFGGGPAAPAPSTATPLAKTTPWPEADTLRFEKELLGFYVSNHPLDAWRRWSQVFARGTTQAARESKQDARIVLAGIVQSVRTIVVKAGRSAGQKMGVIAFEDLTGAIEAVLFTEPYNRYGHLLAKDTPVFLLGRVDHARGQPQVVAERIVPIEGVPLLPGKLCLNVSSVRLNGSGNAALEALADIIRRSPPAADDTERLAAAAAGVITAGFPVDLVIETEGASVLVQVDRKVRVGPTPKFVEEVCALLGEDTVSVVDGVSLEVEQPKKKWESKGDRRIAGTR